MTVVNLQPLIDAAGGTTSTTALFTAEARRAGRGAVRISGDEVTFPTVIVCNWDGTAWDAQPELDPLDVTCYWHIVVRAGKSYSARDVILPSAADTVDFGDLVDVVPDTATIDAQIQQWTGVQQTITAAVAQVAQIQAQIADTEATLQSQLAQAQAALDAVPDVVASTLASILSPAIDTALAAQHVADEAEFEPAGSAAAITLSGLGGITPADVDSKIAALSLGSASTRDAADFDPAGAATGTLASITVIDGNVQETA